MANGATRTSIHLQVPNASYSENQISDPVPGFLLAEKSGVGALRDFLTEALRPMERSRFKSRLMRVLNSEGVVCELGAICAAIASST